MLLSIVIFLPILGVIAIALLKNVGESAIKGIALAIALLTFVVSLGLYYGFDAEHIGFQDNDQLHQNIEWITGLGASYHIGIDGISLWLVLLTTFLTLVCILAAWNSVEKGLGGFMMSLLALETGMLGVFCALDLFLFFVFWEAMLIPMYFLIGIWGGERRIYATIKFVLYTMAGSALMLVGILVLYSQNGNSFELTTLLAKTTTEGFEFQHSHLLFLAFFIAFAIKVPLFPFHTWLPDAHVEAPTVGSVILAGVLAQNGYVWNSTILPPALSRGGGLGYTLDNHTCHYRYNLRGFSSNGATGSEKTGCIFQCESPRFCCVRSLFTKSYWYTGKRFANDQSRLKHWRAVPLSRHDL